MESQWVVRTAGAKTEPHVETYDNETSAIAAYEAKITNGLPADHEPLDLYLDRRDPASDPPCRVTHILRHCVLKPGGYNDFSRIVSA